MDDCLEHEESQSKTYNVWEVNQSEKEREKWLCVQEAIS